MNSSEDNSGPFDPKSSHYGVAYPAPFDLMAIALCQSATRQIRILSPRLDHRAFDNTALADVLSALARRDSHSRVQLLISDSGPIVNRGHRLLSLARRVPSSIAIRKLADHPEMTGETVVLRDLDGVLFMPSDEGPGFYEPDSRASAQTFIDKFDALWQRGAQDPEFRRLGL
ncbi:MAG: hypothetical protein V7746_20515 [Halioglobus sp.]